MQNNLIQDIKNDPELGKNIRKIFLFIILVFCLDYAVSVVLESGIKKFYGLDINAEVLMNGHSHLMLAIDKVSIEKQLNTSVAKYTREGVNVADRYLMLRHYLSGNAKNCKLVVYAIDPWLFTGEGLSRNSYTLFYPFMDNPDVDAYVRKHSEGQTDYFFHKWVRSSRFNVSLINASFRGFLGNWANLKFGLLDTIALKRDIARGNYRRIRIDKDNVVVFDKTLELLGSKDIKVVLFNTPVYHALTDVQRSETEKVLDLIKVKASRYENIHVIDLTPYFQKKKELYYDPIHMNPDGQKAVTAAFSSVLYSLEVLPDMSR